MNLSGKIKRTIFRQGEYHCLSIDIGDEEIIEVSGNLGEYSRLYLGHKDLPLCFYGNYFQHYKYGKQFRFQLLSLLPETRPSEYIELISTPYSKRAYLADLLKPFDEWNEQAYKTFKSALLELYSKDIASRHIKTIMRHRAWTLLASKFKGSKNTDTVKLEAAFIKTPTEHLTSVINDPHKLALDRAIDFDTAELLYSSSSKSVSRDIAAAVHIIEKTVKSRGDTFLSVEEFIPKIEKVIGKSVIPDAEHLDVFEIDGVDYIQTSFFKAVETKILKNCNRIYTSESHFQITSESIVEHFKDLNKEPTDCQKKASVVATEKFSVITGLPGTGKTTLIKGLTNTLEKIGAEYLLLTPTGSATMRLSEVSGCEAKTIHSALGYIPSNNAFVYNAENQLDADWIIIDEASMIDMFLFSSLIDAIPDHSNVTIFGDIDQISSIREGAVLRDLFKLFPSVRMTTTKRFDKDGIIQFCHAICQGKVIKEGLDGIKINEAADEKSLFEWSRSAVDKILSITEKTGMQHVQILAPQYAGDNGIDNINEYCRAKLFGGVQPVEIDVGKKTYRYHIGSKILIKTNMAHHGIYNGDIGFIIDFPGKTKDHFVVLKIRDRKITLNRNEAQNMIPGYCISIHNAQGQEYPYCLTIVTKKGAKLLSRNLVNSAVSRGQRGVIIVAEKGALETCASRTDSDRMTRLSQLSNSLLNVKEKA